MDDGKLARLRARDMGAEGGDMFDCASGRQAAA